MKTLLSRLLLLLILLLGITAWFIGPAFLTKLPNQTTGRLHVPRGATFQQIADSLVTQNILPEKRWFLIFGRLTGYDKKMRAGLFDIPPGLTTWQLVRHLQSAPVSQIKVTLPEGIGSQQMAAIFQAKLEVDSTRFVDLVYDSSFAASLVPGARNLEGYLLPETYLFSWKTSEKELVRYLVAQTMKIFNTDSVIAGMDSMGMSRLEVLTLASIVEGEALVDDERPIIASLYHNRLRLKWPLQADPTIQFILPGPPRRLLHKHLEIDSPYNTYKYRGLPPGPISNPGRNSILATIFPAYSSYLYMVAAGDGRHKFSKTLKEHNYWHARFNELRREVRRSQRSK